MRARRVFHAVDSHTEGMPTRVIVGGVGVLPGDTMAARRAYVMEAADDLRTLLMYEPRGHASMSGAILQPPARPDADWGVVFIEVSGCLPMCGHGTIGVATVLVETGMVEVTEPVTTIRLDVPAGLVEARVQVCEGRATGVTIANVPSYCVGLDRTVNVPGIGEVTYDLAYGGNFYAILPASRLGVEWGRHNKDAMLDAALALMAAIERADDPVHPLDPRIRGCHHVYLEAPDCTPAHSRHAMAIHPGWFDRSPCGTGTSARMAQLHARGLLELDTDMVNEGFLGRSFVGRLVGRASVGGYDAVVPTVTGRAWVTGTAQYVLDPEDPFPAGFLL
jgi:proline racemase